MVLPPLFARACPSMPARCTNGGTAEQIQCCDSEHNPGHAVSSDAFYEHLVPCAETLLPSARTAGEGMGNDM